MAGKCVGISGFELFDLALHELQMDVQRVERIANLMRHTGGQQREGLHPFTLNHLKGFLLLLGGVVNDHRQTAGAFANQGGGVHAEETPNGIGQLQFVPGDGEAVAGAVQMAHIELAVDVLGRLAF